MKDHDFSLEILCLLMCDFGDDQITFNDQFKQKTENGLLSCNYPSIKNTSIDTFTAKLPKHPCIICMMLMFFNMGLKSGHKNPQAPDLNSETRILIV